MDKLEITAYLLIPVGTIILTGFFGYFTVKIAYLMLNLTV
jgi:hypothetical protein